MRRKLKKNSFFFLILEVKYIFIELYISRGYLTIDLKNKIIYKHENVKHSLIINENNIELIRENDIFKNILSFQLNKETNNEYYIKDNNLSVYISIITNEINIYENEIIIKYKVLDSDTEYIYKIEVSDII